MLAVARAALRLNLIQQGHHQVECLKIILQGASHCFTDGDLIVDSKRSGSWFGHYFLPKTSLNITHRQFPVKYCGPAPKAG